MNTVDEALRRTIDRQDELGDLADQFIPLLRAARRLEWTGGTSVTIEQALREAEEFESFQQAVKPGLSAEVIGVAKSILELVPTLKPALRLFGD